MRYLYACFKNYIGFYNGLGLDKVEIDFTKCRNNIVLICGINGSGKSTLMDALNLFPDPNSSYIPERDGEKKLTLFDNGDTYNICIISQCDSKGGRKQTKAFISKNGLELNDNGNITSYKEIIFSEFELDANYISLSKLSGNDRGLGDKTPAERKRFVSNIVDNIEVYNDIYKTLNKKSLIFKSHINTLHTKIQNIGMKDNLEATLSSLKQRESIINSKIMELNNNIVAIEAKSTIDNDEAILIKRITDEYNEISNIVDLISVNMRSLVNKTKIKETEIQDRYKEDTELSHHYQSKISELKTLWTDKSKRLSSIEEDIISMEAEVASIDSNIDRQLEEKYKLSCKKLDSIKSELISYKINPDTDMIYIVKNVLNIYSDFINRLDNLYSYASPELLRFITIDYDPNIINKISLQLSESKDRLLKIEDECELIRRHIDELSILSNKPKDCKNTSCQLISNALKLQKKYSNINLEDKLNSLLLDKQSIMDDICRLEKSRELYTNWVEEKNKLDILLNSIITNSDMFKQVNDNFMSDINNVIIGISNMSSFNDQRDPKKLTHIWNLLEELKKELELNTLLSYEYKSFKDKVSILNSTSSRLEKVKAERDSLTLEIVDIKQSLDKYESLNSSLGLRLDDEVKLNSIYSDFLDKSKEKKNLESRIKEFESKSSKALNQISLIDGYRLEINKLTKEYEPVKMEIDKISGQLTLLDSYYLEYNRYKEKYDLIETLKKYCSPTGGIQTIFMQLYMDKTLELSNQILQMLFCGEYKLLDFIINQNEFRIPFIGSGLPVDDISSGSASQICIMGMIINLVLLHQASTKYNIGRLDEIDGPLDNRNRLEFINILNNIIRLLNIDQLFIISHSIEVDASSVDIIKLKYYDNFNESNLIGNIIYDYNDEIAKVQH